MNQVWKFTGTPENWLTAIRINRWALNENSRSRWPQIQEGDTIIFHSTQRSEYTNDAISAVIGFAFAGGEKYKKTELWWPDEIEKNENIYPYVVPLKEIYLFSDIEGIAIDTPVLDKKEEEVARDISVLLSKAIPISELNEKAKAIDDTRPQFNVMGPPSHVDPIYEQLILNRDSDLFIGGKAQETENLEKRVSEGVDERLSSFSRDQVLEQAKSYKNDGPTHIESAKPHRVRRENQIQKRRVAFIEDYACQICGFKCEYKKTNGKIGWIIEVDHIIDKAEGGTEDLKNLWVLCPNCHAKKTQGIIRVVDKRVFQNDDAVNLHHDHHLNW